MLTERPKLRGYTMKDLQRCAERELLLRRNVYRNRVLTGRMRQHQADAEIDKMAAIAEWLSEMAKEDQLL